MQSIKFSQALQFVKPEYVYLRIKPSISIRNNNTHKLACAISSIYKNALESIGKDEEKFIKGFGSQFSIPTKISYQLPSKVSYLIYTEAKKVEFYFIIPQQHRSFIQEKMSDVWPGSYCGGGNGAA